MTIKCHPELLIKRCPENFEKFPVIHFIHFIYKHDIWNIHWNTNKVLQIPFMETFPNFGSNPIFCNQITWVIKQIWWFLQNCNLIYFQIIFNGWLGQIIKNLIEMVWIFIETSQRKQIIMSGDCVLSTTGNLHFWLVKTRFALTWLLAVLFFSAWSFHACKQSTSIATPFIIVSFFVEQKMAKRDVI